MLWKLNQEQLSRLITPLGNQTKEQTRQDAKRFGFHLADKADSQDLCFTSDNLSGFLAAHLPNQEQKGPITNRQGDVLGTHGGTTHYTVGQRKGLGVAAPQPLYVLDVLPKSNTLVVGPREQSMVSEIHVKDLHWTSVPPKEGEFRADLKVRHSPTTSAASVICREGKALVRFDEPQPGVAPGQFAVFHHGDLVLGGGEITRN
jgi:tRNA-specific 2-thiouridylase